MNKKMDFQSSVAKAMTTPGFSHMRPVVEKELLHYDLLFILDKENLLDNLTFQGGTSLRLCYGAPRLSEDLDQLRPLPNLQHRQQQQRPATGFHPHPGRLPG
jgi:hypothetical protein